MGFFPSTLISSSTQFSSENSSSSSSSSLALFILSSLNQGNGKLRISIAGIKVHTRDSFGSKGKMMLRSSSTPMFGSLQASCSESPTNNFTDFNTAKHARSPFHGNFNKLPSHRSSGPLYLTSSCSSHSSPISPAMSETTNGRNGFRRAQSEGNLEGLATKPSCSMLQTIPSFSSCASRSKHDDQEEDIHEEEEEEDYEDGRFVAMESEKISNKAYGKGVGNLGVKEITTENAISKMHIAIGLDVGGCGFGGESGGGGGGCKGTGPGGDDGDGCGMEEHYKRAVEENPGNPLFMRNYAQFLYESKKDLQRAEEYYSRAMLADPQDGEILSQYAKFVWEINGDQKRAISYFELAVRAAPENSHVHAAYASFLWEAIEDEEEDEGKMIISLGQSLRFSQRVTWPQLMLS
ncbi:hypothetical protein Nepgr_022279 [Nepenthes gracilis]|uniref:Uncharacterized protein n=1 Tax=Nepenthes gracilis TaxID=150966 RepID=A0AAD3T004_NEPGR|nr:hypothetical protein Nepgr_022279 [Nepenthes gracilis]